MGFWQRQLNHLFPVRELEEEIFDKEPVVTFGQLVKRRFLRNKMAIVGVIIVIVMILFCFIASLDFINDYQEYEQFFDPDISYSADQLETMRDEGLIKDNIKVLPTKTVQTSALMDITREETGDPIPLNEALSEGNSNTTYRLHLTSFRLAEKNRIIKLGICQNADVKLYAKKPPTLQHLLGTDRDGNDVFTRLQYGGRISLMVGLICMIICMVIGITIGGLSGYYGGIVDAIGMRVVDVFLSIPDIPIIILINSMMRAVGVNERAKIYYLMLIIGALYWPGIARVLRGQILSLREREFMIATEAGGIKASRRIFKHLIPNVSPQIIVNATLLVGDVILLESALSFLGLGISPPFSSWGIMVSSVNDVIVMLDCPYVWVPPGICILLTVMAINFIGDGLRDAFDPKMKR